MKKKGTENAVIWYIAARSCLKDSLRLLYKNFNNIYRYPVIVFSFGHIYSDQFKEELHKEIDPDIQFIELDKPAIPPHIKEKNLFYNRKEIPYVRKSFPESRIGFLHTNQFVSGEVMKHHAIAEYDYALKMDDDAFIVECIDFDLFEFVRERGIRIASFGYKLQSTERVRQTQIGLRELLVSYIRKHNIVPQSRAIDREGNWKGTGVFVPIIWDLRIFRTKEWNQWWDAVNESGGIYEYRWGDLEIHEIFLQMHYPGSALYSFDFYEKGICRHGGHGMVHQDTVFMRIIRQIMRKSRNILREELHKILSIRRSFRVFIRRKLWNFWYGKFSTNPFRVKPFSISKEYYLEHAKEAKQQDIDSFFRTIRKAFGVLLEKEFVDELALSAQITIKKSALNYAHGYLLYGALRKYLWDNPHIKSITTLEVGTARGFSSVIMAKALADSNSCGKVITIDVLPSNAPIYWNCIHDAEGKKTRFEILQQWKELVEKYIIFLQGYSDLVLKQLGVSRVHFAFIDGSHEYEDVKMDAEFVIKHQKKGDILIFDDYTPSKFPGIVKLVDEIADSGKYNKHVFRSDPKRGYAYCVRN